MKITELKSIYFEAKRAEAESRLRLCCRFVEILITRMTDQTQPVHIIPSQAGYDKTARAQANENINKRERESAVLPSGGSLVELITLVQLLGRLIREAFLVFWSPFRAGLESGGFENIYFLIPYWI